MKSISQNYKSEIKENGREIDNKITFTSNGIQVELGAENLNSLVLHYEGDILKSVMKQLDIDSNTDIPLGTQITAQFGLKVNGTYEYINLGNFIVYSSEKQEDLNSYKIICYDKLLYSMIDYEDLGITYPITIRNYINSICTHLGLTFANFSDTFANYNKEILNELYLDEDGNSLNYTFRDVLDELAEVTASTICINNNDELEIRYINNTNDTIDEEYFKDINVNFGELTPPINTITFKRSADSDAISLSNPLDLSDDLKNEIVISDNQILNSEDRADYLSDILNQLYGLTYSLNDFSSTGITYYELCDKYNVVIGENTYPCIMFNDEIEIMQGLQEFIHTDMPKESETDYNTTTQDDRTKLRTELVVNKQEGTITGLVRKIEGDGGLEDRIESAEATLDSQGARLDIVSTNIDEDGNVLALKRTNYEFGSNGIIIQSENYKSIKNTTGDYYFDNDVMIGKYTKDGSVQKDLALFGRYYYGINEDLDVENFTKDDAMFVGQLYEDSNGEEGFGHFYNGN